jgi:hypothetical protein
MNEVTAVVTGYGRATADLRATAKWLAAAGAGVAATLLAGVNLRSVPLADMSVVAQLGALGAVLTALAVTVGLILLATEVLATPLLSLNDLAQLEVEAGGVSTTPRLEPLKSSVVQFVLERRTHLLEGEDTIAAFYAKCGRSEGIAPIDQVGGQLRPSLVWPPGAVLVEEAAQYFEAELVFQRLRSRLKIGAFVLAAAVLMFVWLTSEKEGSPMVTTPLAVTVRVVDASLAGLPSGCPTTLQGVAVGGSLKKPDVVLNGTATCPSMQIWDSKGVVVVPVIR